MNRLAGYRVMLGKKQSDIADLIKVSRQSYSEKERGNIPFKDVEKVLIRDFFREELFPKITIDDIFFS
ncbi:helix-turn-helix transcriptional regulator [Carnobacterium maltaromaticum]|uniref:helix-turn-helix transcriptional regulator n=1 Tax=Carnobacterium maltaromaticum TaxID=2751 RepID=UPI0019E39FD3|nr:conserved hypothetical protein [Carnobacterium maltaromaticum]